MFFTPREIKKGGATTAMISETMTTTTTRASIISQNVMATDVTAVDLCGAVSKTVRDPKFATKHSNSTAPLAMMAFASVVVAKILRNTKINVHGYFDGITMTVPDTRASFLDPYYHSIVGQKLLCVD